MALVVVACQVAALVGAILLIVFDDIADVFTERSGERV